MSTCPTKKIGDLLSEDRGISVGVMYPGEDTPGGVPLIRVGDISDGAINPIPGYRISQKVHHEYRRTALEGGECLITLVGRPGHAVVVPPAMAGWNAARALAVVRLREASETRFFTYAMAAPETQHTIRNWCNTTVQATLNLKEIKALPIPWPAKEVRESVVAILSALDDKIELNRRMNATLEAQARALFRDWFVDFGPVKAKMARAKQEGAPAYLAPDLWNLFPATLDTEGKPEGWEWSIIGDEVDAVGGSTPSTAKDAYWDGDIAWTTPKDLSGLNSLSLLETGRKITAEGLATISSGLLPVGTVLMSSRAPVGYLAINQIPVAVNQGYIAMKCTGRISNWFTYLWAKENMDAILQNANGSTFQEISKRNFRPLPVLVAEGAVLSAFDDLVKAMFEQIVANDKQSRTLAQTRDLLLPKLMSGEIRVREAEKIVELVP